jgi:hypothetical protein
MKNEQAVFDLHGGQDAPRLTPSMRIALDDLGLRHLTVLYPGDRRYDLERRVTVVPLAALAARSAAAVLDNPGSRGKGQDG